MPEGLPEDWRERFVAMVAGRAPEASEWFTGGPGTTPERQAAIYPEQYRLRLHDGLRAELPGLVAWVTRPTWDGEGDTWDDVFRAWLRAHPATSFTLNRVADGFPEWFAARGAPAAHVALARLDRAVSEGFEAADAPRLDPVAPPAALRLQPHVALLRLPFNLHDVRHAVLTGSEVPALVGGDFPVVVYRVDREMRHRVVSPGLYDILSAIGAGAALADAIAAPLRTGALDVAGLHESLAGWMQELAERDLVGPA